MAGDKLDIKVDYYIATTATNNNTANGLNTIINALGSIIDNSPITTTLHGSGSSITTSLNGSTPFTGFMSPQNGTAGTGLPKAYLNIIFFDNQFKYVSGESVQVSTEGSGQTIYRIGGSAKIAPKNGFAYIYVSNESDNLVYFDNLQVTHEHGPLLQESHYYPYGLGMAGISSSAITNAATNAYKANGATELGSGEWADGKGLELYETTFRSYDAQIGRFMQVDPLMESNANSSGYVFVGDNPALFIDPMGLLEVVNEGGPPDEGTGDRGGYMDQWAYILGMLIDTPFGGSYSSGGGGGGGSFGIFTSDADAFMNGSMAMDRNNSWGNDGFATSFQDAQKRYYKNGGTEAAVGYLAPNIYLKGFSKQAIANLDAQIARNARMGLDGNHQENNGLETSQTILEAAGFSYESTREGIKGAQILANRIGGTDSEILTGGDLAEGVGKGFAYLGAGLTIYDGVENGWKPHHTADLVVDATIYTISASVPVAGWIVGGVWFFGNIITKELTGKTVTENIFDDGE